MISVERRKESYFQVLVESTSKVLLVKIVTYTVRKTCDGILVIIITHSSFPIPNSKIYQVVIAAGSHLFPFRTEKLSPPAPMVLQCNAGE